MLYECGQVVYYWLVVVPALKIKTGFRGFKTERNPEFRKFTEIW